MTKRSHQQLSNIALWIFLLTLPTPVASEVVCQSGVCQESSWANTIWYYTEFEADVADDEGVIRVTAVDELDDLWFNGDSIRLNFGGSRDWTQMNEYQIDVEKGTNEILMAVTNQGAGDGSGLLVELETGAQRTGTKVGNREEREGAWRWSSEDPDEVDVDWDDAPLVQAGSMDLTKIVGRTDLSVVPVAGYPGDVDIGTKDGGITLSLIDGRNLALGQPSNVLEANDGVLTSSWTPGANALNKHVSVDLREIRRVSGVRVITKAPGRRGSYFINSIKGYSVQVSEDQFRWSEVAVLHGITEYEETTVRFEPVLARYIRIVVAEIDGVSAPDVAEIEVYGEAYSAAGTFESELLDLDERSRVKNIGKITWEADVPEGTSVALQFRTMVDGVWSPWTREYAYAESNTFVESPEPASQFQYRVQLSASVEGVTPRFRNITVESSADDVPAESASGSIFPVTVEMGTETPFTYVLDLEISGQNSVERLIIAVPGPVTLDPVAPIDGLEGSGSEVELDSVKVTSRGLEIPFDPPLDEDVQLSIHMIATMYAIAHSWSTQLLAPDSENPQNVVENTLRGGWLVSAPQVLGRVLLDAQAQPAVFTPNGDLTNDHTTIVFTLAKAEGAPVSVQIFSLDGSLVRELFTGPLSARRYDGSSPSPPGRWDGTDAHGKVVPPGIYLYELLVEADEGDERRVGTIGLVY